MKKVILFLVIAICTLGVRAEDIKVGDAKYKLYPNGTADLKDYKKAVGDIVIPETVTHPKTGKVYPVTQIAQNAFKGSKLTSVKIPSSVSFIDRAAFKECTQLVSVELPASAISISPECFYGCLNLKELKGDLNNIERVGANAFYLAALGSVEPVKRYYIGNNKVKTVYRVYPKGKSAPTSVPLVIPSGVNMENVNVLQFTSTPPELIFEDKEAGKQALDVLNKLIEVTGSSTPQCRVFYGIETTDDGMNVVSQKIAYGGYKAIEVANENFEKEKFIAKLTDFVETAINKPISLPHCYSDITPEEGVKYNSYMRKTVYILCDSVYMYKPEFTPHEKINLEGFINNCLMFIGGDYGIPNMTLEKWAKADMLNCDTDTTRHKEDYERLLKLNERLLQISGNKREPYHHAMQLAALCGLGRWKEASAYFPKVHRSVTENGTYAVPYELTYMQDEIKKRGYKAITPTYKKGKSVSKQGKQTDLVEYFAGKAVEAGVRHYEKKRAERKAREMFYQSVGLDKKGRPIK